MTGPASVTGAGTLLRASVRHNGRHFVPWVTLATVLALSSIVAYPLVFPTQADRAALAGVVGANPALGLIFGPAFDLSTADGFTAWRSLALGGLLAGLGATFAVINGSRGQEDSGQAELLASGVMGRSARLLAAVGLALVGSVAVGVVAATATWVGGGAAQASFLLGATFTATGWMMAGIAAITAQIGTDARTASSLAVATFGSLFVLRGFVYSVDAPAWAVWINPLAWMTETQPAHLNRWWPLAGAVALAAVMLGVAFVLQSRRNFGQGLLAAAAGPAQGNVATPLRLVMRINRGALISWAVGFVAFGVVFGYFTHSVSEIFESDSTVQRILAAGATSPDDLYGAFLVTILSLIGIVAAIAGVQVMLRLRKEELEDRVEPVLAAVSRPRYFGATIAVALGTTAAFVGLAGVIVAGFAATAGIGIEFGEALAQAAVTIPAVWTVTAVAITVVGARPRASLAAWVGVIASFVLTLLGPTFGLDPWVLSISPFRHVPAMALAGPSFVALGVVGAVGAALVAVGFAGFRRRDIGR